MTRRSRQRSSSCPPGCRAAGARASAGASSALVLRSSRERSVAFLATTRDVDDNLASVGPLTVLPEVDGLPGPERQAARADRNRFIRFRDGAARVRGHVVEPLVVVLPVPMLGGEIG